MLEDIYEQSNKDLQAAVDLCASMFAWNDEDQQDEVQQEEVKDE